MTSNNEKSKQPYSDFTEGQKSIIKEITRNLLWKYCVAIAGIMVFIGGVLIGYIRYLTSDANSQVDKIREEGNAAIELIKTNAKKPKRIVALATDFGLSTYYVSTFKGRILSEHPYANIVDISHEIGPFDINEGAWVIYNAARTLPEESIIWGIVNPGADLRDCIFLVTKSPRHYLIGADPSLFDHVVKNEGVASAYIPYIGNDDRFGTKAFAPIVNKLLNGYTVEQLIKENVLEKNPVNFKPKLPSIKNPIIKEGVASGHVCGIDDRWGNILTNIPGNEFFTRLGNHRYSVQIGSIHLMDIVYGISFVDGNSKPGVIVEQDGWIQIAIYGKKASEYFGIETTGQEIIIKQTQ